MTKARFSRFAWGVLGYNLLVILWGAYVRTSGSGAGCGKHWPLCNGVVVPRADNIKTIIEASHRVTSGIAMIAVFALTVQAFRLFSKGSRVRRAAGLSSFFMLGEVAVGAMLVLLEHVAQNPSLKRGLSMALHLNNTFLLLASLAAIPFFVHLELQTEALPKAEGTARSSALITFVLLGTGLMFLVVGTTGAIAALGDTLFPPGSFAESLLQDSSSSSHLFLRLRALHPFLALLLGGAVTFATFACRLSTNYEARVVRRARLLNGLFLAQLGMGLLNLTLLVPAWTQLLHLLLADVVWITFVQLGFATLSARKQLPTSAESPAPRPDRQLQQAPQDHKAAADETAASA